MALSRKWMALKCDYQYFTFDAFFLFTLQRVGGLGGFALKFQRLFLNEAASSADLGGSSKYSNENFED